MNWDAIGAIGEIIGAVAVVGSLIYLAIQIREQNREARLASAHQAIEGYRTSISWLNDPSMAELFIASLRNYDGLSDAERLRFDMYMTTTLRSFEDAFFLHRENRLDHETWEAMLAPAKDFAATETFGKFIERRRHHFRKDFIDYFLSMGTGNAAVWESREQI